jgi:hypothetical protein
MMENQSKHENVIAIWDEQNKKCPTLKAKLNEIGLYLYLRYRPHLMRMFNFSLGAYVLL